MKAQAFNFRKWPNADWRFNVTFDSWAEEVDFVDQFFNDRANWLDNYITSW